MMMSGAEDTWTFTTTDATSAFEAAAARRRNVVARTELQSDARRDDRCVSAFHAGGRLVVARGQFTSTIWEICIGQMPPTYIENMRAPMPVLYMHDGQNLFDPTVAFGGNAGTVGQTMDAGANDASIAEAIVVGIENTANRIPEYTPVADPTEGGGNGDAYLQMILTEPAAHRRDDAHAPRSREYVDDGSPESLAAFITAYAGVTHADVFGRVGIMRRPRGGQQLAPHRSRGNAHCSGEASALRLSRQRGLRH